MSQVVIKNPVINAFSVWLSWNSLNQDDYGNETIAARLGTGRLGWL